MNIKPFFVFILAMMPIGANAGLFGPSDYDECILESMKGVTSDVAARQIAASCRKKFPPEEKKKKKSKKLGYSELSKLTGKAGLGYGNYFSGNIYNGNKEITITEISVRVTTTNNGKKVSRTYTDEVTIAPQTTADFGFSIIKGDKDADYSWGILGARGY